MYIIDSGVIELTSSDGTLCSSRTDGDFFGEHIFFSKKDLWDRSVVAARSISASNLFIVTKKQMQFLMEQFPRMRDIFIGKAETYMQETIKEIKSAGSSSKGLVIEEGSSLASETSSLGGKTDLFSAGKQRGSIVPPNNPSFKRKVSVGKLLCCQGNENRETSFRCLSLINDIL